MLRSGTVIRLHELYASGKSIREISRLTGIRKKELDLAGLLLEGLGSIKEARLVGLEGLENRTAVVSVDFPGYDNAEIAYLLDRDYGIRTPLRASTVLLPPTGPWAPFPGEPSASAPAISIPGKK